MLTVYSPHQREHQPSEFVAAGRPKAHPEVPERLDALLEGVRDPAGSQTQRISLSCRAPSSASARQAPRRWSPRWDST